MLALLSLPNGKEFTLSTCMTYRNLQIFPILSMADCHDLHCRVALAATNGPPAMGKRDRFQKTRPGGKFK
ncbi:MAG: hypothetical protein P1U49_03505 [Minwuia sp.]|nr:hypothetical protein [Minwuia sp.]